ncbi:MAG: hypothetical protein ACRYGF_05940 [Janthinobacterium lividum]
MTLFFSQRLEKSIHAQPVSKLMLVGHRAWTMAAPGNLFGTKKPIRKTIPNAPRSPTALGASTP